MITEDNKFYYNIGYRDAVASILAQYTDKVKLPELAEEYKKNYEEHFSHKWPTGV